MKIEIKDLDISDKRWNYGMKRIAEAIIAEVYHLKPDQIPFTMADFNDLKFKGYNPMDMNQGFELQLKIVPKLRFKNGNSKENG